METLSKKEGGTGLGKKNLIVNQMLERKENFADLINGTIYEGCQILRADMLEKQSCHSGVIYEEEGSKRVLERDADIRMKADMGTYSLIWTNETQAKVHYAMPVRVMLQDALEYVRQVQELEKKHKDLGEKLREDEFLSGIQKEDRISPVITTVLYCGTEWDGSKSLREMFEVDERDESLKVLEKYLPEYRIHVVDVSQIEDMSVFKSCLQHIFSMVKYNSDKKELYEYMKANREEIRKMDHVEQLAALVLLGEQKRVQKLMDEKEEWEGDVCKAIDDLIEDGRQEGRAEGRAESILELLGELGSIPAEITMRIRKEENVEVLREWLKLAARADNVQQFLSCM